MRAPIFLNLPCFIGEISSSGIFLLLPIFGQLVEICGSPCRQISPISSISAAPHDRGRPRQLGGCGESLHEREHLCALVRSLRARAIFGTKWLQDGNLSTYSSMWMIIFLYTTLYFCIANLCIFAPLKSFGRAVGLWAQDWWVGGWVLHVGGGFYGGSHGGRMGLWGSVGGGSWF